MSYNTIHQCANDRDLQNRITAASAAEGYSEPEHVMISYFIWPIASSSDVEAAYASALAAENPNPGGDEAVITDGMILAKIQALASVVPPSVVPPPPAT